MIITAYVDGKKGSLAYDCPNECFKDTMQLIRKLNLGKGVDVVSVSDTEGYYEYKPYFFVDNLDDYVNRIVEESFNQDNFNVQWQNPKPLLVKDPENFTRIDY
jgi:hypothetical protein